LHRSNTTNDQIEKDLPRTFPGFMFTPTGYEFQPALRRILRAYSLRNPYLGYCQSMNFIAGGLLVFLEEEQAFWALCWLVEDLLHGYFSRSMMGLQVETRILEELIKENLPQLGKHLQKIGFNPILLTTQWYLCLFLNNLPSEAAFRIWDVLFVYGKKVMLDISLSLFKCYQKEILEFNDPTDVVSLLHKKLAGMYDVTALLNQSSFTGFIQNSVMTWDTKRAERRRTILYETVKAEVRGRHDTLQIIELTRLTKFNKKELESLYKEFLQIDPLCEDLGIHRDLFFKVLGNAFPQWKFDEYFFTRMFYVFDNDQDSMIDYKELMVGISVIYRGTFLQKLRLIFKLFDSNEDFVVDKQEMTKTLTSLYEVCKKDTDEETNVSKEVDFFANMLAKDSKRPDMLTFDEFREVILLQPCVVQCFSLESSTMRNNSVHLWT